VHGGARHLLPSERNPAGKLYSEVAKAEDGVDKRYKLTVKTRTKHSPEAMKNIIKPVSTLQG